MQELLEFIKIYGFPIVMCLLLYMQNRQERKDYNDRVDKLNELHANEVNSLTASYNENTAKILDAINNNTVVMREIKARLEVDVNHA